MSKMKTIDRNIIFLKCLSMFLQFSGRFQRIRRIREKNQTKSKAVVHNIFNSVELPLGEAGRRDPARRKILSVGKHSRISKDFAIKQNKRLNYFNGVELPLGGSRICLKGILCNERQEVEEKRLKKRNERQTAYLLCFFNFLMVML